LWQLAHHFWFRGWTDAATFGDVVSACEKVGVEATLVSEKTIFLVLMVI
jgi:hypothetical protein